MIVPRSILVEAISGNASCINPANATSPVPLTLNQISWQSAFWPVIACTVTLMLQSTGRMYHAPLVFSTALRAFPSVCLGDTALMLIELMLLRFQAGCNFTIAARHVWYSRFHKDFDDLDKSSDKQFAQICHQFLSDSSSDVPGLLERACGFKPKKQEDTSGQIPLQTLTSVIIENNHPDDPLPRGSPPDEPNPSTQTGSSTQAGPSTKARHTSSEPTLQQQLSEDEFLTCQLYQSDRDELHPQRSQQLINDERLAQKLQFLERTQVKQNARRDHGHQESQKYPAESSNQVAYSAHASGDEAPIKDDDNLRLGEEFIFDPGTVGEEAFEQGSVRNEEPEEQPITSKRTLQDQYYPGSEIDQAWRLSISAFLLGALPQVIKVFAMKGVIGTQILVSIFLINFTIPEIFRMVAGTAGAEDLHPLPIVLHVQRSFTFVTVPVLLFTSVMSLHAFSPFFGLILTAFDTIDENGRDQIPGLDHILAVSLLLALAITLFLAFLWFLFKRTRIFSSRRAKINRTGCFARIACEMHSNAASFLSNLLALEVRAYVIGPWTLTFTIIGTTIAFILNYAKGGSILLLNCESSEDPMKACVVWFKTLDAATKTALLPLVYPFIYFFPTFSLRLLYRLLFMGTMSKYPRRLTGINGSMKEFLSAYLVLLVFCGYLGFYALFQEWNPVGTYKPPWTEFLG